MVKTAIKPRLFHEFYSLVADGQITFLGESYVKSIQKSFVEIGEIASQKRISKIDPDHILIACGFNGNQSLMRSVGVAIWPDGSPKLNPNTMETDLAGIYVIGTAIAGMQTSGYQLYIENTMAHCENLAHHLIRSA